MVRYATWFLLGGTLGFSQWCFHKKGLFMYPLDNKKTIGLKTTFWLKVVILGFSICMATLAGAKDLSFYEEFETLFFRTIQNITIEKDGVTVLLEGGAIYYVEKGLHYSGTHSWLVAPDGYSDAGTSTGEAYIKPKGTVRYISALVKLQSPFGCGLVQVADVKNNLIYEQRVFASGWMPIEVNRPEGQSAIKEMRISHCGSFGLIAVDDLLIGVKSGDYSGDDEGGSFSIPLFFAMIGLFFARLFCRSFTLSQRAS